MKHSRWYIVCAALLLAFCLAVQIGDGPAFAGETAPDKPVLKSVKSPKVRQLTVRWAKVADADGYEIRCWNADTSRSITVDGGDTTARLIKGLPGGRTYSVKIRSFREEDEDRICSAWSKAKKARTKYTKWTNLGDKFRYDPDVNQLIFVKYLGNSKAELLLYRKTSKDTWKKVLKCRAYTGQNGINKKKEGDRRTPTGTYDITMAFGIKADPGSRMKYKKINKYLYWCGDRSHYNKMVDVRRFPHKCHGEHLINYTKQYAYAMNVGYNKSCKYKKGSAIFLHCFGNYKYTLGCISVSPKNMKKILRTCEDGTRICIYKK